MYDDAASSSQEKIGRSSAWLGLARLFSLYFLINLFSGVASGQVQESARLEAKLLADAVSLAERGYHQDALARFQRIVRRIPASEPGWINYGVTLLANNRIEEAEEAFLRAIRLRGPLRPQAVLYLSEVYRITNREKKARRLVVWLLRQRDLPKAFLSQTLLQAKVLGDSLALVDDYEQLINLAILRRKQKNSDDAYTYAQGALNRRDTVEARLLLSLIEAERGEEAKARMHWQYLAAKEGDADVEFAALAQTLASDGNPLNERKLWLNAESELEWESTKYKSFSANSLASRGIMRLGYRFWQNDDWRFMGYYRLRWDQLLSPQANTLFIQNVDLAIAYDPKPWGFELGAMGEFSSFANQIFLLRTLVHWGVAHRWEQARLALTVDGVANSGLANPYSYLTGPSGAAKLDFTYATESASFGFYTLYSIDLIESSNLAPNSIVPLANKRKGIGQFVLFPVSRNWSVRQGLYVGLKRYTESAQPDDRFRRDTEWKANLGFFYRTQSPLYLDFDLEWRGNRSNLATDSVSEQTYRELLAKLSLLWEFRP